MVCISVLLSNVINGQSKSSLPLADSENPPSPLYKVINHRGSALIIGTSAVVVE